MLKSRGAAFADYQKRVSAFFPGHEMRRIAQRLAAYIHSDDHLQPPAT